MNKNTKEVKVDIFIQARMGSTRLPGKILLPLGHTTILGMMVERLKKSNLYRNIVILTTNKTEDDVLKGFAKNNEIEIFRGSESDLIDRYFKCAIKHKTDIVVRLTGDCPFIDPVILDNMLRLYLFNWPNVEFMTNCYKRTFARGIDIEILSYDLLKKLDNICTLPEHREHVVPYVEENTSLFKMIEFPGESNDSEYRLTIDTDDDYKTLKAVYGKLLNIDFSYGELIDTINNNNLLYNMDVYHKSYYE